MRFQHLREESLDKTVQKVEKTDEKTVAKAQLLHSKEWKEHVAEHHDGGQKAQLVAVDTTEESGLFKKAEEKKDEKEEQQKNQHNVEHGQTTSGARTGYLSAGGGQAQRGADDAYFGAGSARLKAISGQCSCGMEVSTGWHQEQTTEQRLKTSYATPGAVENKQDQDSSQPLYASQMDSGFGREQERSLYSAGQTPGFGHQTDQKRRRTSSL